MNSTTEKTILGLDIGANSIGWALIKCNNNDTPAQIIGGGVRVFPAGVNIDPKSGKNNSLNKDRREARLRRRLLDRRQMRKQYVLKVLQQHGFLPQGKATYKDDNWKNFLLTDPYKLRAKALDNFLEPYEFGRVIFHLCQRRGFLSNRKSKAKEEKSLIKEQTDLLSEEIKKAGARTLGEFLARLNPQEQRKRGRYTLRQWYEDEFNLIWNAQQSNPKLNLNTTLYEQLKRGLFFQRPIKIKKSLIGHCELEPKKYRASVALLSSQQFRLLQTINNTRIFIQKKGVERPLTLEEKRMLIPVLEKTERLTFAKAKKILKLETGDKFNFERGGEKEFKGNTTAAKIIKVVGEEKWNSWNETEKKQIVEDLLSIQNENALVKRAKSKWQLNDQEAEELADIELEDGYINLSTKAIIKILPHLNEGLTYAEAVQKEYPHKAQPPEQELLPPVENLRNPIVQRSLSELRHLINAIVKKYGKPHLIRIELARDLKQNARAREETWKKMRNRQQEREKIIEKILREAGIQNPSRQDIEKGLLWEECGGECPYTGEEINFANLFGEQPLFDIEHIIPYSRCLDDSFANKTLCKANENRNVKHNKTPYEAYGNSERWPEIIRRVEKFKGAYREEKLRRFLLKEIQDENSFIEMFCSAQLNDTRYASRKAAEYIAQLYPAEKRKTAVQTCVGKTTSYLRSAWNLNKILNSDGIKNRDDHRHHLIDAIVVALTSPSTVRTLTMISQRSLRPGTFKDMPLPWENFNSSVESLVQSCIVSHYVDRSINGQLHEETNYGIIIKDGKPRTVIRKPVSQLKDASDIVDDAVRKAVADKLAELNLPPNKAFQDEKNLPFLTTRAGRKIPIRRVRIFENVEWTRFSGQVLRTKLL